MAERGPPKVVYEGWLLLRKKHDATQWRMRFFQLFDSHELVYHKTDKRKQHVVRRIDLSSILHIHRSVQPSQDGGFFQLDHCISIGDPKRAMKALTSSKSFAPYFLDIVADDRTWCLRFPDSDARDGFFQDLQIYVCDHLDFFAYHQGPVWFQDPASHSWVESYGVCTACYFVLFESYEQYEYFLQEQNQLSDQPEQRLLSLKQRPCLLVPLRICSSEPREEVFSPTQTAPALIAKYTFCVDCSGTTLHFAVDDEGDFSKWLRTIKSSLAMFQLNANITTFSSTATRSPSLRPDLDTSAPELPNYALTITQSDPSTLSSLPSLAIPAPSTHRHRSSHSMSSIALSSTVSHAPSAMSISALSPESSLSSPPRSQRTTPSGSFISNATSTRRPVAAMTLHRPSASSSNRSDRDRHSDSDTDAAPQVDEAAIKQVADQLRAALSQSNKKARADSRHRHSSSASASSRPRLSSSSRRKAYPLAHSTNLSSPASASTSPPNHETAAEEAAAAITMTSATSASPERGRHGHSHSHGARAASPRASPVSMLREREDDNHSAHSGHSSHRYSRHSSTDGTSDSESGTPSEVMENFRMSLLAAHLSLFKEFLKTGQVLMKYSGSGRSRARRVRLEDGTRLHWNRHSSIDIKDILQIVCPRDSKHNSTSSTRKSDRRCFSIITSSETINLEAPSSDYRDYWVHGLRLLMADARK